MSTNGSQQRPPALAVWLVDLFSCGDNAEPITGDLLEEFSVIASGKGIGAARRWYWKQSLKTSVKLFGSAVRSAPWLITSSRPAPFSSRALRNRYRLAWFFGVLGHYPDVYEDHMNFWSFCIRYGIPIVGWVVAILLGCLIGVVAKYREIVATATFGVFRIVGAPIPTIALFWTYRALFPHHPVYWNTSYIGVVVMRGLNFAEAYRQGYGRIGFLFLYFIQPFASVLPPILGGLIVRKIRSSSTAQSPLVSVS